MKILILQLARLGDIYQTWPVVRALKRSHPNCELHFLTRSRFAAAVPGGDVLKKHWLLDTREILSPLIADKPDLDLALTRIDGIAAQLKDERFDLILNLTFSPFSSYLTKQITVENSEVRGYTRFSDGYLSIPDDGSAYFYAQVGPGHGNRAHLTDLFAYVAGVTLVDEDWSLRSSEIQAEPAESAEAAEAAESDVLGQAGRGSIVIHIGASIAGKTLSWSKWSQIAKGLLAPQSARVVLVGSKEEAEAAEKIASLISESSSTRFVNLVGRTNLAELFQIIRRAQVLIGGDSAPVQIASLTNTLTFNISFPMVSFWETGPRAKGSRILPVTKEEEISAEEIVGEVMAMTEQRSTGLPVIRVPGPCLPYVETRPQPQTFEWELNRALYMEEPFPVAPHELFLHGVQRLAEVNILAREQIDALRRMPTNKTAAAILERVDEIMEQILKMVPETRPLIQWFRTERIRIGPMPVARLIEATDSIHRQFADILAVYAEFGATADQAADQMASQTNDVKSPAREERK